MGTAGTTYAAHRCYQGISNLSGHFNTPVARKRKKSAVFGPVWGPGHAKMVVFLTFECEIGH